MEYAESQGPVSSDFTVSKTVVSEQRATAGLPRPSAVVELLKPITWFPPVWAFLCGAVSSGVALSMHPGKLILGLVLAGPLVCAMSQAINDWHDRHVDAINEPNRPIPSGRVPGKWGLYLAGIWALLSLSVAALLGPVVLGATAVGLFLAWAYSAPPLRLKRNGWFGNTAVAFSYEGLAWVTGAAVMLSGVPDWRIFALAALYSLGAHGIMTLNDFKAMSGDAQMGIRTLPVQLGAQNAARMASLVMAVPQIVVIWLLFQWGMPWYGWAVCASLGAQLALMAVLLLRPSQLAKHPKKNAALYNATGTTLYVSGMMVSAFALSSILAGG